MSAPLGLLALFFAAQVRAAPPPYIDPRRSMSGYQAWCAGVNGSFYNDTRGVGCIPGSASVSVGGYSFGGANPFDTVFAPLGQMLGQEVGNILSGSSKSRELAEKELARKRAEEFSAQHKQEEQWRRQREAQQTEELGRARERIFGKLKGGPTSALASKSLARAAAPATSAQRSICAAYLMVKADENSALGRFDEAAYLSRQAASSMEGRSLEVSCPVRQDAAEPSPQARQELYSRAVIYGDLFAAARREMAASKDQPAQAREKQMRLLKRWFDMARDMKQWPRLRQELEDQGGAAE